MSLPPPSDLSSTWTYVSPGLNHILGNDSGVTSQMYMNIYTAIYNYCVNKSRSSTSNKFLGGAEIYAHLQTYLKAYVTALVPTDDLLTFYVAKWTRFNIGAGYLNNIFDYMNRYWVYKERSDGRRDVYDVITLCTLTWRDQMFAPHQEALLSEVMAQVEKQRNGEIINTLDLAVAVKSLVTLGVDVQDLKKPNLAIYVAFERQFVEATAAYYARESLAYLETHLVVDYIGKCETRLREESARAATYLHEHSKKPLADTLNRVLVVDHTEVLHREFSRLLQEGEAASSFAAPRPGQLAQLLQLYTLLSRVPAMLDPLAVVFYDHVHAQGLAALAGIDPSPKVYVKTLVSVYQRFHLVLAVAFLNDAKFDKALDDACRRFVNTNPIATPTRGLSRTPELLAKYCDLLLKKSAKDTEDMSVDEVMCLFQFVSDKDAFETHYRRLLAKRLIYNTSGSAETEELLIQKLQDENSTEYTAKMAKMFQDIQQSGELRRHFENGTGVEFTPFVLAETMWPFTHTKYEGFQLPAALEPTYTQLETLYLQKHSGRQLKWLWNLCRVELKANLNRAGKPPFVFSMHLMQLAVLLRYNERALWEIAELAEATGIERELLEGYLAGFVKHRLLEQAGDVYTIVEEYKLKKLKVNFSSVMKAEEKREADDVKKEIDEDRRVFLQACVVRVMKARKVLGHGVLVSEVVGQSYKRYQVGISEIKRCVDGLIEKGYLRRDGGGYEYVA